MIGIGVLQQSLHILVMLIPLPITTSPHPTSTVQPSALCLEKTQSSASP